jgi:hypothetical protein
MSGCPPKCVESRYDNLGAGGGGGNPDVVPGANPARKDLVTGTTSTTVTFAAPTGGSGSGFTYGATLSKPVGSGAGLAGTGLGPYTISSMADGESYGVIFTATDAGDGQVANNFGLVDVATALTQPAAFLIPNVTESIDNITVDFVDNGEFLIPNVTVVP